MSTPSAKIDDSAAARCIQLAAVFQDQLLEEPLSAGASATVRSRQQALISTAQAACRECPLIIDCLYSAIVEYDVAGYVAGTTPSQRAQIRRVLDVTVEPEDFDTLAGATRRHRQVNHREVVRLHNANPHEVWRHWRSGWDVRFPPSNVIYVGNVGRRLHVAQRRSPPSQRLPPRPA